MRCANESIIGLFVFLYTLCHSTDLLYRQVVKLKRWLYYHDRNQRRCTWQRYPHMYRVSAQHELERLRFRSRGTNLGGSKPPGLSASVVCLRWHSCSLIRDWVGIPRCCWPSLLLSHALHWHPTGFTTVSSSGNRFPLRSTRWDWPTSQIISRTLRRCTSENTSRIWTKRVTTKSLLWSKHGQTSKPVIPGMLFSGPSRQLYPAVSSRHRIRRPNLGWRFLLVVLLYSKTPRRWQGVLCCNGWMVSCCLCRNLRHRHRLVGHRYHRFQTGRRDGSSNEYHRGDQLRSLRNRHRHRS